MSIGYALTIATVAGLPIAMALAIFKYRLYDIDVIINRTLVYAGLTGTLALLYFGSVVLLQNLFRTLTGQAPSSPSSSPPWPLRRCSVPCAGASRTGSTAASTAASTTRSRCWPPSRKRPVTRPTWTG